MKNIIKTFSLLAIALVVTVGAFAAPGAAITNAQSSLLNNVKNTQASLLGDISVKSYEKTTYDQVTSCDLSADATTIATGGSVTLSWNTQGFDTFTLNGQPVSGANGSKTFTNVVVSTSYTFIATNSDGSRCQQTVDVLCLPPAVVVEECELDIQKTVNKQTAKVGDELTYTIDIKNTGTADCTGGGVKIFDVVDANVIYKSNNPTSNIKPGYGNKPVYSSSDRTLRFNGDTLSPGESGVITWTGTVANPAQCGDFTVRNQAKATARELNNFNTWVYSETVQTDIDNDCVILVCEPGDQYYNPEADLRGDIYAEGKGRVVNSSAYCDYKVGLASYQKFDEIIDNQKLFDSATGIVGAKSTLELMVSVPSCQYQIDLFYGDVLTSLDGQRYGERKLDFAHLNNDKPYCGVPAEEEKATVVATKIVCTDEADLPDYGKGAGGPNMTANTAADWVATHPSCSLESGWEFQWTDDQVNDPGDTKIGRAGAPWSTFGPTNANGQTSVEINLKNLTNSRVWFREVLQSGYIPFANEKNGRTTVDAVSAELYCDKDVLFYDNHDFVEGMQADETYYCVAWNSPEKEVEDTVPVCKSFTASPKSLPVGGGNVTLAWNVTQASNVSISPTVGSVSPVGSKVINVTQGTTYVLTAEDSNGDKTTCQAPVTVSDSVPVFTCEQNVNFSISDSSIRRGDNVTLNWSTTNVDTVSISNINASSLSGNQTVSPSNDTTYILTATQGSKTVNCPVSVDVSSGGGGGGGSSSPRCELEISDDKITAGEEVTLRWDTSRASEITIKDDRGNVIFTTDDYLSKDKEDFLDGSIKVKPTRDTEYTITAERGSRDRECKVDVEVEDDVVVLQTRDQQPLVAGISLSQVPYTGFEAGPFMTILFYALLVAWSLFITYLMVIRNRVAPASIQTYTPSANGVSSTDSMKQAEAIRPDVFAPSVMSKIVASQTTPMNLPTGIPVAGQDVMKSQAATTQANQATDTEVTAIENRAHSQKALLSSDAVRHFISATEGSVDREQAIDQLTAEAKKTYPLEDGWIVLNQARMQSLCETLSFTSSKEDVAPATVPAGTGSLAEAIVTGNVVAAYQMIGHRPMFALADAAADLDAVYRNRKGESNAVSDMLSSETQKLSEAQISEMIAALTGALDGTYTDEAAAVKMSIMKAIKVTA